MQTWFQKVKRIVFAIYLFAIHAVVIYFVGDLLLRKYTSITPVDNSSVAAPTEVRAVPTPLPVPQYFGDTTNTNTNVNAISNAQPSYEAANSPGLIIPVVGVRPDQLIDTFTSARSEGRTHDAIDIMASSGTPVIAATDGEIVNCFDSERGGITIYQLTSDRKFILYYGHLQRRADGISVGTRVQKGTTIGFVGDTGNAGPGNYHLHFSIAIVTDPKRFSSGTYINPYPLLKNGEYPQ